MEGEVLDNEIVALMEWGLSKDDGGRYWAAVGDRNG